MEYLCLAAGKGTRFGALGRYLQKCMYPVGLTPFVELSLRNLRAHLADDAPRHRVTFVIGHLGEQLRAYFGDDYDGLPLRYLEQGSAGGTGHALLRAHEALRPDAPVTAWLADLYVPRALFAAVDACATPDVVALAPAGDDDNASVRVTTDGDEADDPGRVRRIWYGDGPLADIGLWRFAPEVLASMTEPTGDEIRALPNLQRLIDAGREVAFVRAEAWLHLGGTAPTPEANVRGVVRALWEMGAGQG